MIKRILLWFMTIIVVLVAAIVSGLSVHSLAVGGDHPAGVLPWRSGV